MSDWTRMRLIDAVGFTEDAGGRVATGRYFLRAADLGAEPARGESAQAMHAGLSGWRIDRVELVPVSGYAYQAVVTARPSIELGNSFDRSDLQSQYEVSYGQEEFYFGEGTMGVRPLPYDPQADGSLSQVDYRTSPEIAGYVPVDFTASSGVSVVRTWTEAAARVPGPCPFTRRPAWRLFGKRLRYDVATVTFHVRATFVGRYLDWVGVNDDDEQALPVRFRLPEARVPGVWAAGPQWITPLRDGEGRAFLRVVRRVRRVPKATDVNNDALRWDSGKLGGVMRWQRSG